MENLYLCWVCCVCVYVHALGSQKLISGLDVWSRNMQTRSFFLQSSMRDGSMRDGINNLAKNRHSCLIDIPWRVFISSWWQQERILFACSSLACMFSAKRKNKAQLMKWKLYTSECKTTLTMSTLTMSTLTMTTLTMLSLISGENTRLLEKVYFFTTKQYQVLNITRIKQRIQFQL